MRVIYNPQTGSIIRTVAGGAPTQVLSGEAEIVSDTRVDWSTHYVVDFQVIAFTDAQRAERKKSMPVGFEWQNSTMSWVDTRELEDLKNTKWQEIKDARTAAETAGLQVAGKWFDADANSQTKIAGAVQLATIAGPDFEIDWTLADNTVATLSGAEMIAVGVALGTRTSAVYSRARVLRALIDDATTADQLNAVTWD